MKLISFKNGLTLLEVIFALTLVGLLVAAMTPFIGRTLTMSGASMFELKKTLELATIMDAINQDYKNNYTTDIETLRTRVNAKVHYGTGNYTIVANKYIVYTDANNDRTWLESDDGLGTNKVLRVTIKNDMGTQFTRIFVKQ